MRARGYFLIFCNWFILLRSALKKTRIPAVAEKADRTALEIFGERSLWVQGRCMELKVDSVPSRAIRIFSSSDTFVVGS